MFASALTYSQKSAGPILSPPPLFAPSPLLCTLSSPRPLSDSPYLLALLRLPSPARGSSFSIPAARHTCTAAVNQRTGGRGRESALSLACLMLRGHEVLPKESSQVRSCILVTPCLSFCLWHITSTIFKR